MAIHLDHTRKAMANMRARSKMGHGHLPLLSKTQETLRQRIMDLEDVVARLVVEKTRRESRAERERLPRNVRANALDAVTFSIPPKRREEMRRELTNPRQSCATRVDAQRELVQEEVLEHIYSPRLRELAHETDRALVQSGRLQTLAPRTNAEGLSWESIGQHKGGTPHVDARIA